MSLQGHDSDLEVVVHTISHWQEIMTKEEHTKMIHKLKNCMDEMKDLDELNTFAAFGELLVITSMVCGMKLFYQLMVTTCFLSFFLFHFS